MLAECDLTSTPARAPILALVLCGVRKMAAENGVAKTPREHFDADDERPKLMERTLHRSAQYRNFQPVEPGTQLLAPADIWRDMK